MIRSSLESFRVSIVLSSNLKWFISDATIVGFFSVFSCVKGLESLYGYRKFKLVMKVPHTDKNTLNFLTLKSLLRYSS